MHLNSFCAVQTSIWLDKFDIHIEWPWKILRVWRDGKGENCKKYLGYVVIIITFSHRSIKTSEKIDLFPIIQGITNWAENALAKAVLTHSWSNFILVLFHLTLPKPTLSLKEQTILFKENKRFLSIMNNRGFKNISSTIEFWILIRSSPLSAKLQLHSRAWLQTACFLNLKP